MSVALIIIIFLIVGIGFLFYFLLKKIIIPHRAFKAANYKNRNNTLKAIRTAKAAIEKNPQNAEAHYLLGKAYLVDKREEQALREYKSASRLGITGINIPESEFRETIAVLYAKFNEPEEALKEYVILIKTHPENPEYYFQAGLLFTLRGKNDLAEKYLRKAVSLNSQDSNYHFELGMLFYLSKRTKDAGLEFETALRLDPMGGKILLYMGKVHKDLKEYTKAIPYLEKAARDQNYKLPALVELGSCYMSLKMVDNAIHELERATSIITNESEPDSLYARYFLAMCHEKNRDFAKAITQWDKIYTQKKNFRDVGEKLTQYIEYRTELHEKSASK